MINGIRNILRKDTISIYKIQNVDIDLFNVLYTNERNKVISTEAYNITDVFKIKGINMNINVDWNQFRQFIDNKLFIVDNYRHEIRIYNYDKFHSTAIRYIREVCNNNFGKDFNPNIKKVHSLELDLEEDTVKFNCECDYNILPNPKFEINVLDWIIDTKILKKYILGYNKNTKVFKLKLYEKYDINKEININDSILTAYADYEPIYTYKLFDPMDKIFE